MEKSMTSVHTSLASHAEEKPLHPVVCHWGGAAELQQTLLSVSLFYANRFYLAKFTPKFMGLDSLERSLQKEQKIKLKKKWQK